jgi:hypothetical protein
MDDAKAPGRPHQLTTSIAASSHCSESLLRGGSPLAAPRVTSSLHPEPAFRQQNIPYASPPPANVVQGDPTYNKRIYNRSITRSPPKKETLGAETKQNTLNIALLSPRPFSKVKASVGKPEISRALPRTGAPQQPKQQFVGSPLHGPEPPRRCHNCHKSFSKEHQYK